MGNKTMELAAVLAILLMTTDCANADGVVNGDFEAPVVDEWSAHTLPEGEEPHILSSGGNPCSYLVIPNNIDCGANPSEDQTQARQIFSLSTTENWITVEFDARNSDPEGHVALERPGGSAAGIWLIPQSGDWQTWRVSLLAPGGGQWNLDFETGPNGAVGALHIDNVRAFQSASDETDLDVYVPDGQDGCSLVLVDLSGGGTGCSCLADLNGDGVVNGADLAILLGNWSGSGMGDLNDDGVVDGADLAILLGNWGPC